jgi:alpha-N-acetylglucosaminidase
MPPSLGTLGGVTHSDHAAATAVIGRVAGRTDSLDVEFLPLTHQGSRAGYESRDGRLALHGTDTLAVTSAFGRYLAAHVGRRITWDRLRLDESVSAWPDAPATEMSTPFEIRYHFNVVTFGYSMAYWDWDRWEREIDLMALHGVTHPLMMVGHESVLAETFRRAGLAERDVLAWIGSAAHLPWMFMGGMNSFGGPLPESWFDRRITLAQKILTRQRALGMTPVLPMFGGHVPPALADDEAGTIQWQGWRTPILRPDGERYQSMAADFLAAQHDLFGGDHHYAVDPFIESVPPTSDPDYLASVGRGIHAAMSAHDPQATWVLQGWPMHYHRDFWSADRVRAFLRDVPDDRLILLDLWGEHAPMWRRDEMYSRRWVWSAVHNFGGRFALFGDLDGLRRDVDELRGRPTGRLEGLGLAMEAIENNTVFYELAADLVWGIDDDVRPWIERFAHQRYGAANDETAEAWRLLHETLYGSGRTRSTPSPIIARPWDTGTPFAAQRLAGEFVPPDASPERQSANIDAENDPAVLGDLTRITRAARLLMAHEGDVADPDVLRRDVVDLVSHVLAQSSRLHIRGIIRAVHDLDAPAVRRHLDHLREAILDLDTLAGTRGEYRVGTWIEMARRWGDAAVEADTMERDARSLVTVWGHQHSGLHDYSGRHWEGLLRDFYLPRWELWGTWLAAAIEAGTEPDVDDLRDRIMAHEEAWRSAAGGYDPRPSGEPVAIATGILDRLRMP